MDKIIAYRLRRDLRLLSRELRWDADEVWRTTENGKHYQVNTESGEVTKGNIGVGNVKKGAYNDKAPRETKEKRMNRREMEERLAEIDKQIHQNDLAHNTGSAYRDQYYEETDRNLRDERRKIEHELNPHKKTEKMKGEKKFRNVLKNVTSEKMSDEDYASTRSEMSRSGFNDEEIGMMKDKSWYKPSKEVKDKIISMAREGASDSEIRAAINRDIYKQIDQRKIERNLRESEEFQKKVRAEREAVDKRVKEYNSVKNGNDEMKDKKAYMIAGEMAREAFDVKDMEKAIYDYFKMHGKKPEKWGDVRELVGARIKEKFKKGSYGIVRSNKELDADIDAYLKENGRFFMDAYKNGKKAA